MKAWFQFQLQQYLLCKYNALNFFFCMFWNVLYTTANSTLVITYKVMIKKIMKNNGANGFLLYDSIMTSGKLWKCNDK